MKDLDLQKQVLQKIEELKGKKIMIGAPPSAPSKSLFQQQLKTKHMKKAQLQDIKNSGNYTLIHKKNKQTFELRTVSVDGKPAHQLYKKVSDGNYEYISKITINKSSMIGSESITKFEIFQN
jgi:hypothetical protein